MAQRVERPSVEVLLPEARQLARRRHLAHAAVILTVVVVLGGGLFLLLRSGASGPAASVSAGAPPRTPVAIRVFDPPDVLVQLGPEPTHVGQAPVVEFNATTGAVVHRIHAVTSTYPANGFTADWQRGTLYFDQLTQSTGKVLMADRRIDGGKAKVTKLGTTAQFSPDGRYAAYSGTQSVTVVDLGTGEQSTVHLRGEAAGEVLAWQRTSNRVVAVEADGSAHILDVATKKWNDGASVWTTYVIEGPGPLPGTVVGLTRGTATPASVVTIDARTGAVVGRTALPAGFGFLAAAPDGYRFVLATAAPPGATPGQQWQVGTPPAPAEGQVIPVVWNSHTGSLLTLSTSRPLRAAW